MRTFAWLWGASALGACGGTSEVPIGDGGEPETSFDHLAPDDHHVIEPGDVVCSTGCGPDQTVPPSDASDGATDQTNPADAPSDMGAPDTKPDVVLDAHLDSPVDSPVDAPVDSGACPTTCVPPVPFGWSGPEELYEGNSPPECGVNFNIFPDYQGYASPFTAPAAVCTCTCGDPMGVTCSADAQFYSDPTCMTACGATPTELNPETCTDLMGDFIGCGMTTAGPYVVITPEAAGSCTPLKTTDIPPVTWGGESQACSPFNLTMGCSGEDQCAPATDPGYLTSYCIYQTGNVACPTTGYTTKVTFYGGDDDTRGCSACTCGPVTGTCTGDVDAYSDGFCLTPEPGDYTVPQACTSVAIGTGSLEYTTNSTTGGMCKGDGGTSKGTATPVDPTTFCCTP